MVTSGAPTHHANAGEIMPASATRKRKKSKQKSPMVEEDVLISAPVISANQPAVALPPAAKKRKLSVSMGRPVEVSLKKGLPFEPMNGMAGVIRRPTELNGKPLSLTKAVYDERALQHCLVKDAGKTDHHQGKPAAVKKNRSRSQDSESGV